MDARGRGLTNLLLAVMTVLIAVNLAVPGIRDQDPPPPEPAAQRNAWEDPGGGIMIRIPGRLVDEWGITAEDARKVVDGLSRVGRNLRTARGAANDSAAIATLRNLSSAQAQFQAAAAADRDRDGCGEYGSFRELSGACDVRGDAKVGVLNPPVLSGAFRAPTPEGAIVRSGYHYAIYLPDSRGGGVNPDAHGYAHLDDDLAETTWCAYAWPVNQGESGRRVFFINQCGDVLTTETTGYSASKPPPPGAAFLTGGDTITGEMAVGKGGQDGNVWRHVN
jgi:hypothetical protein